MSAGLLPSIRYRQSPLGWAVLKFGYTQIHRNDVATPRKQGMLGGGYKRRGLDPLQSDRAQGVVATPRGC